VVGQKPLNQPQRESLALIRQSGRDLMTLIETILDVAKIEAGRMVLLKSVVHPATLLAQAVRRTHALTQDRPIDVAIAFDDDLPLIQVDKMRLVQTVNALVGAVIRILELPGATDGTTKSAVTIHASRLSSAGIRIEIEGPNGTLTPAELKRLLEPESSASGQRPHGGITLAVTLARSLTEMHGGKLEVTASARGSALFAVSLPG
jgi:signal transduction histidine kinase